MVAPGQLLGLAEKRNAPQTPILQSQRDLFKDGLVRTQAEVRVLRNCTQGWKRLKECDTSFGLPVLELSSDPVRCRLSIVTMMGTVCRTDSNLERAARIDVLSTSPKSHFAILSFRTRIHQRDRFTIGSHQRHDLSSTEFEMLAEKKTNTNIGVGIGIVLQIVANVMVQNAGTVDVISGGLGLVGLGFFIWGCFNYAQGKGYPALVGLLGILSCCGLIILVLLPDKNA